MGRKSAVDITFNDYTRTITSEFLEQFGASYMSQATTRNKWREAVPYSAAAEKFLIFKTKIFISTLPSQEGKYTDPQFLDSLTTQMADYLSAFTMHGHALPISNRARKELRKQEKEKLKNTLFVNNAFIQNLFAKQREKREKRRRNPQYRNAEKRENALRQARKDLKIMREVQSIFTLETVRQNKR